MAPTPVVPPLHAAIWEGDVARARSLLAGAAGDDNQTENESSSRPRASAKTKELLEAKDAHGNTALHLATRVVQSSQRAIIQTLLEHGANVSSRSTEGWSCLHDATLCDDEFLLAQLFLQGEKQLWSEVEEYQDDFLDALERLPDFEVEIFVEAYSWIPGVSNMLPSQTNRLLKRGSQLRVDSSMKGLERFNLNHGNVSHIFTGRSGGGKAYMLNHDTKKFYDISGAVSNASSLAKVDLGIHMLLTKELSATSIDSANLEFTKLKDVKEIKTKQKNGSTKRACPWTGTKYEMKNVAATFLFRNPVNPKREHRKFAEEGINNAEAALNVIDGYVSELSLSSSKEPRRSSNARSMMDTTISEDDEEITTEALRSPVGGDQELWLPKGQTMEMHLDVLAGDTISWKFTCNSKAFSFVATKYEDDVAEPVARCGGAKNASITGSFVIEQNGSFVLKWVNTQKGFTLDKKGIKIVYDVTHARLPSVRGVAPLPSHPSASILRAANYSDSERGSDVQDEASTAEKDLEICQRFLRLDHIPNPMTVVMPFSEYFGDTSESGSNQSAKSDSNPLSSIFKRTKQPKSPSSPTVESFATFDGKQYRNTFRNLTLLPTLKRYHKNFEAKVFMAGDFPIQTKDFLPVIEFLSKTGDQVKNISEFFRMKLPPGFPVRFELPMMFTVRAAYTFQKAIIRDDIDPSLFELPEGYTKVAAIKDILPQQH